MMEEAMITFEILLQKKKKKKYESIQVSGSSY